MTYGDFVDLLEGALEETIAVGQQLSPELVLTFTNAGLMMISDMVKLEVSDTFVTVANTVSYDCPADLREMKKLVLVLTVTPRSTRKMEYRRTMDDSFDQAGVAVAGAPWLWSMFGDKLYLAPAPDKVYTIERFYRGNFAAVAIDADDLPTDALAFSALMNFVGERCARQIGERELATDYRASFVTDAAALVAARPKYTGQPLQR